VDTSDWLKGENKKVKKIEQTSNKNKEFSTLWKYKTDDLVCSVAISSDGRYIVAGSEDKNIYFFVSL